MLEALLVMLLHGDDVEARVSRKGKRRSTVGSDNVQLALAAAAFMPVWFENLTREVESLNLTEDKKISFLA